MVSLLKSSLSKKSILNLHLKEPLLPLRGNLTQICQVVMNLVANTSGAIGERSSVDHYCNWGSWNAHANT